MKEWQEAEHHRQTNGLGNGRLRDEIEEWGETPVPSMANFADLDFQDVVEMGITGELVEGISVPSPGSSSESYAPNLMICDPFELRT